MSLINVEQAKTQLSELIEAAVGGEEVVIAKDDQQVKLVPVSVQNRRPQFGSAKGLIKMTEDFDEPLKDFDEYVK
ncbi:MAG TPA: hypothetical protein VIW64_07825 [Pyrinomonadaceae bacterium]|jgi:antitoxin (DNA-binding transcriptional repressor) of toxin-antitoxin stability system